MRVEMLLVYYLAVFSLFNGMWGAVGVCRARCAGWFCGGAASWVVGASSDRHSMAVVWGGLGVGIDTEPSELWLLFVRLKLLCE